MIFLCILRTRYSTPGMQNTDPLRGGLLNRGCDLQAKRGSSSPRARRTKCFLHPSESEGPTKSSVFSLLPETGAHKGAGSAQGRPPPYAVSPCTQSHDDGFVWVGRTFTCSDSSGSNFVSVRRRDAVRCARKSCPHPRRARCRWRGHAGSRQAGGGPGKCLGHWSTDAHSMQCSGNRGVSAIVQSGKFTCGCNWGQGWGQGRCQEGGAGGGGAGAGSRSRQQEQQQTEAAGSSSSRQQ